jgi:hypothetical protein
MALQPHTVECIFGAVLAMALIIAATTWAFSPNPIPPSEVIYGDPRDPKIDPIDWVERTPFTLTLYPGVPCKLSAWGRCPRLIIRH